MEFLDEVSPLIQGASSILSRGETCLRNSNQMQSTQGGDSSHTGIAGALLDTSDAEGQYVFYKMR